MILEDILVQAILQGGISSLCLFLTFEYLKKRDEKLEEKVDGKLNQVIDFVRQCPTRKG